MNSLIPPAGFLARKILTGPSWAPSSRPSAARLRMLCATALLRTTSCRGSPAQEENKGGMNERVFEPKNQGEQNLKGPRHWIQQRADSSPSVAAPPPFRTTRSGPKSPARDRRRRQGRERGRTGGWGRDGRESEGYTRALLRSPAAADIRSFRAPRHRSSPPTPYPHPPARAPWPAPPPGW